jgi:hypothetical protein
VTGLRLQTARVELQAANLHGKQQHGVTDDPRPHADVRAKMNEAERGENRNDEEDETDDPGDLFGSIRSTGQGTTSELLVLCCWGAARENGLSNKRAEKRRVRLPRDDSGSADQRAIDGVVVKDAPPRRSALVATISFAAITPGRDAVKSSDERSCG